MARLTEFHRQQPATGTNSTAASSNVVRSPSLSSSSNDEFTSVGRGESPCCSRSQYSSLCCSRRSRRPSFFSFARAARSCSRCYAARPAAQARGVGRSDRTAFTVTIFRRGSLRQTRIRHKNPNERRNHTHWLGVRKYHERPEVFVGVRHYNTPCFCLVVNCSNDPLNYFSNYPWEP
jgi:hypothetical protein